MPRLWMARVISLSIGAGSAGGLRGDILLSEFELIHQRGSVKPNVFPALPRQLAHSGEDLFPCGLRVDAHLSSPCVSARHRAARPSPSCWKHSLLHWPTRTRDFSPVAADRRMQHSPATGPICPDSSSVQHEGAALFTPPSTIWIGGRSDWPSVRNVPRAGRDSLYRVTTITS